MFKDGFIIFDFQVVFRYSHIFSQVFRIHRMPRGSLEMGYMDEGIPPTCNFNREHDNLVFLVWKFGTRLLFFPFSWKCHHPNSYFSEG